MSLPFLETIGLTKKEAEIYELLLKLGEVPAGKIIKETKFKRATVYKTLYSLEKKGLISKRDFKKKIHFRPESPTQLLGLAESQFQTLERAKSDIQAIIPQLSSSYVLAVEKPVVSTFEGIEGLKKIYEDSLREGETIYSTLQTGEVEPELFKWLTTSYIRQRVKKKIWAKVIVASGKWAEEYQKKDKKELRESVLVPSKRFPFQHETLIYGDKVAFVNYKKGESLIGVVIKHPQIAKTVKAWFDLAWEGGKNLTSALPN